MFQASTTLFVGDVTDALHVTKENVETSISLAATYGALIRSQVVLQSVIEDLGLETSWQDLKGRVHITLSEISTATITVAVRASSPGQASAIATAIADRTVALGPARSGTEALSFASRQAVELQSAIARGDLRIDLLEALAGGGDLEPVARAELNSMMRGQVRLIEQWRQNHALVRLLAARVSPNTVRILEPTQVNTVPFRPKRTIYTGLGVAAGITAALGVLYASPRRRRPPRDGRDPWIAELIGAPGG
jgi:capsular polysaccharide biosynthesis protein